MNAVQIVTIKEKFPLYKKEELANKVELVTLNENGFELVAQKDLYKEGDQAVYIQPDYCLSEISLFASFLAPEGDESKSLLGKVGGKPRRIRAKSFNLSKVPNGGKVYSNGILLPFEEVVRYILEEVKDYKKYESVSAAICEGNVLGIYKYEEPEISRAEGGKFASGTQPFPEGWYKTDEENINNKWGELNFPITLVGTQKIDGSSVSISSKYICSRKQSISPKVRRVVGRRKRTFLEWLFGKKPDLNIYKEVENENSFIEVGKKYQDLLIENDIHDIVLRGEANGKVFKGSGNSLNATAKEEPNIKFFGVDKIENGVTKRLDYNGFKEIVFLFQLPTCPELFNEEFKSKEELVKRCEEIFDKNKNMEGVVIRNLEGTFSAKFMNNYYDSKK
jgi:hypothetical protein|nr:MAG TPA: putative RNA ligase [Caudoviricetes sp.]